MFYMHACTALSRPPRALRLVLPERTQRQLPPIDLELGGAPTPEPLGSLGGFRSQNPRPGRAAAVLAGQVAAPGRAGQAAAAEAG